MNTFIVDEAYKHEVEKFIGFGSVCAFPGDAKILTETNYLQGEPFPAHKSYAYSKRMMAVQLEAYKQQYGFNSCTILPSNIFGECDNYNLEDGHIVPSIIHKFYNAIRTETNVKCWGDGSPLREFIYAEDLAKICLELLQKDEMPQRLIIPGQEYSIKEIVDKIDLTFMKEYNFPSHFYIDIEWDKTKPNGQMRRKTESLYFNKLFPNFEYTNIDSGLKESAKWFMMNYPNVRL